MTCELQLWMGAASTSLDWLVRSRYWSVVSTCKLDRVSVFVLCVMPFILYWRKKKAPPQIQHKTMNCMSISILYEFQMYPLQNWMKTKYKLLFSEVYASVFVLNWNWQQKMFFKSYVIENWNCNFFSNKNTKCTFNKKQRTDFLNFNWHNIMKTTSYFRGRMIVLKNKTLYGQK